MRRLFGQLLSVYLPGMGLRYTNLTVVEVFSSFSKLRDIIGERDPTIRLGMTPVFQDGLGLTVHTRGSSPLR